MPSPKLRSRLGLKKPYVILICPKTLGGCTWVGDIVPLSKIEYGTYGDLLVICPKPYYLLKGDYSSISPYHGQSCSHSRRGVPSISASSEACGRGVSDKSGFKVWSLGSRLPIYQGISSTSFCLRSNSAALHADA